MVTGHPRLFRYLLEEAHRLASPASEHLGTCRGLSCDARGHRPLLLGGRLGRAAGNISPGAFHRHLFGRHVLRRSEEHTSELQSLMRISYAVFCLKKKKEENT